MPAEWAHCVYHIGAHVETFLTQYLGSAGLNVLLIGGAGFDPISIVVPSRLATLIPDRLQGFFLREERPSPAAELLSRAELHQSALLQMIPGARIESLEVFASDNAVIGGRGVVHLLNTVDLTDVTDVFVDLSALSIGVAFPLVRHLLDIVSQARKNLHILIAHNPPADAGIVATLSDYTDTVHGFKGGWGLDSFSESAKLWMPQLAHRKRQTLERIHRRVGPHAVCPILPFPSVNPRLSDELIEYYSEEFTSTWQVDARDLIYVSESGPLDLYRTILRTDDLLKRVFRDVGGSQIILSPVGSKALAAGALMAALDRDFTVIYVETLGYSVDFSKLDAARQVAPTLVHIWLSGSAYRATNGGS